MSELQTPVVSAPSQSKPSSLLTASVWMVVISVLLFFMPLLNGFVGGLVGGYKVGSVGRALSAALLPSAVVTGLLWLLFAVFSAPVWGVIAGATVGLLVVLADLGLFLGAAIGGALSPRAG
jgi:hypothetical protein